jgi:hypothetical protein
VPAQAKRQVCDNDAEVTVSLQQLGAGGVEELSSQSGRNDEPVDHELRSPVDGALAVA